MYVARTRVRRAGRGFRARTDARRPAVEGGRCRYREGSAWRTRRARRTTVAGGNPRRRECGRLDRDKKACVAGGARGATTHPRGCVRRAGRSPGARAWARSCVWGARSVGRRSGAIPDVRALAREPRRMSSDVASRAALVVPRGKSASRGFLGARAGETRSAHLAPAAHACMMSIPGLEPPNRALPGDPCRPRAGRCARLRLPLRGHDDARHTPRHHLARNSDWRAYELRIGPLQKNLPILLFPRASPPEVRDLGDRQRFDPHPRRVSRISSIVEVLADERLPRVDS